MKILCTLSFFILLTTYNIGQDCDCTIYPFKPPSCTDYCNSILLANANEEELKLIVGLSNEIVKKIVTFNKKDTIESIKYYNEVLTFQELDTLKIKIHSLTVAQVKYLQTPELEKENFREEMEKFFDAESQLK